MFWSDRFGNSVRAKVKAAKGLPPQRLQRDPPQGGRPCPQEKEIQADPADEEAATAARVGAEGECGRQTLPPRKITAAPASEEAVLAARVGEEGEFRRQTRGC